MESSSDSDDDSITARRYKRIAWCVVLAGLLTILVGLPQVPVLLHYHQPLGFAATPDSPGILGQAELKTFFPAFAAGAEAPVVLLIRGRNGKVLTKEVEEFTARIERALTDPRAEPLHPLLLGLYASNRLGSLKLPSDLVRRKLLSKDQRSTLLVLLPTSFPSFATFREKGVNRTVFAPWLYRKQLMEFLHEMLLDGPADAEVLLTGNPVIEYERFFDRSIELLLRAELCVLPFTTMIFIWLVREVRLLVFPPLVLLCSLALSAACSVPLAKWTPLSPDVPPAMISVLLAFSLDYSLFILSRFMENHSKGVEREENAKILVCETGHTIVVSGILIAIAFFGAFALPERNLHSAGQVLGITVVCCMLVNIALSPSLLLLFGWRFVETESPDSESEREALMGKETGLLGLSGSEGETLGEEAFAKHKNWFRFMRLIERCPRGAVCLVFLIFLPLTWQLPKLHGTADIYAALPRDMPSVLAMRELAREFPGGQFDPYFVVLTGDTLISEEGYKAMLQLCGMLQNVGVDSILGPVYLLDRSVDWQTSQRWQSVLAPSEIHQTYRTVMASHVNGSAVLLEAFTDFLPRGSKGASWVRAVRQGLEIWQGEHPQFTASLSGGATLMVDAQDTVMQAVPLYLLICLLLPLRLAFALLFTLAATFGTAVVFYQTPLLHGLFPWLANYDGLCYEIVPMAVCIAIALGLDYDIFLVSRIVEFRKEGFNDPTSIVLGVANTGGIISGAGAIMALAFSGLFFSPKLLHQQFAFLLVTSVLLDTFVVRTILVPAMMLSAGDYNWWPRQMPHSRKRGPQLMAVTDAAQSKGG
ncbi:unnamed protein product [Durusdinium trenchii]|uniref:Membrane transport protein MMPL domain-containing protein n=1 Tax=Durusdinium trenchii TaxID=1381693 RepID=A0ABP0IG12_9DINO